MALKHKILALTALAAVLPLAVVSALLLYQKQALVAAITEDANTKARQDAGQVAEMVYRMCQMCNRRTGHVLEEHLRAAAAELNRLGEVGFHNNQISWDARNQFGGAASVPVKLATMTLGGRNLVPNRDFNIETPLVDVVTRFTSGFCTVFQRMNAQGDMLRIATTVPAADGKRAIGTFLPRRIPNGEENEVLAAVLRGETYVGRAMVLDQWHAAAYEPIWDSTAKKEVVGMLYVGFNLDEVNRELREAIQAIRVGKSGSVFVVQGKGEHRGEHIIAKDAASDQSNMWDIRDAAGRPFIQSAINKALQAPEGVPEFERYPWREKDRRTPWMKVTAVTYFAPWDWVIGATTSEDDYSEILANLDTAVGRVLHTGPLGGVVVLLAVLGLALILARAIVNPITEIIGVTKVIAEGNLADANANLEVLKHRLNGKGTDEPGQLFSAVSLMTKRLCSLVSQMQRSCVSLASTATQIAATSRQQETTVTEFGASTSQVNVAVKEISVTSQELAKTMEDVKRVATETEHVADTGRNRLGGMEASLRQLAEATVNISGRLAVINEKAANINSMVTTITKVADQTNLLSLNASIEAEKAGEYGHGFAVVAREIRRLADQTGVASLEIEHTVREMQSSVAAGVMEVKKFSSEVARGVQGANEISAQIEQIIEQVKVLLPRFETVNVGMRAQAEGAGQISVAMTQLTKGARDASESIKQFKDATEQLKEAAKGLQVEASRFKV